MLVTLFDFDIGNKALTQPEPTTTDMPTLALSLPIEAIDSTSIGRAKQDTRLNIEEARLPNLFEKETKEKKLSVSGKPTVEMGESMTRAPNVTDGEADIELKFLKPLAKICDHASWSPQPAIIISTDKPAL